MESEQKWDQKKKKTRRKYGDKSMSVAQFMDSPLIGQHGRIGKVHNTASNGMA